MLSTGPKFSIFNFTSAETSFPHFLSQPAPPHSSPPPPLLVTCVASPPALASAPPLLSFPPVQPIPQTSHRLAMVYNAQKLSIPNPVASRPTPRSAAVVRGQTVDNASVDPNPCQVAPLSSVFFFSFHIFTRTSCIPSELMTQLAWPPAACPPELKHDHPPRPAATPQLS